MIKVIKEPNKVTIISQNKDIAMFNLKLSGILLLPQLTQLNFDPLGKNVMGAPLNLNTYTTIYYIRLISLLTYIPLKMETFYYKDMTKIMFFWLFWNYRFHYLIPNLMKYVFIGYIASNIGLDLIWILSYAFFLILMLQL